MMKTQGFIETARGVTAVSAKKGEEVAGKRWEEHHQRLHTIPLPRDVAIRENSIFGQNMEIGQNSGHRLCRG